MKHENQTAFRREVREAPAPGNLFTRALTARTIASLRRASITSVVEALWPNDKALLQLVTRATTAPATTFTTGWAAELARTVVADTLTTLGAASAAAEVLRQSLVLDWNGAGIISAPAFVASANNSGFVKEGDPIPVRQLSAGPALLSPYKLATIAALTREMVESGNAEALISDALVQSTGLALDSVFFDANAAVANTRPAGIRNGIAALTASASTDLYEAFAEDLTNLVNAVGAVGGKGPFILVAGAGRIASMSLHYSTAPSANISLVASSQVGSTVIAIAPKAIAAALSADPDVETTDAAVLVMDTAPGAAGTTGASERSVWQTDSLAVKVRWPVSWALRNAGAVAWLTPNWK